jgi:hypothetical protein
VIQSEQEDGRQLISAEDGQPKQGVMLGEFQLDKKFAQTAMSPQPGATGSVFMPGTHRSSFNPAESSIHELSTLVDARKMRAHKEVEVRKLHNRIQVLQLEEDRALRRIEETRTKAQQMIDYRLQQEENIKSLQTKREREMIKLQSLAQEIRRSEQGVKVKVQQSMFRKKQNADIVKQERLLIRKEINKLDKIYLR